jgi:hypothetical protein
MRLTLSKGPKHSKPASLSQTELIQIDIELLPRRGLQEALRCLAVAPRVLVSATPRL